MAPLTISTDPARLDVELIHRYLSGESYWAKGISRAVLERALSHSLCFGGYVAERQVAFARVVTDWATFANLKDVFVVPDQRGNGYGIALIDAVVNHPDLHSTSITLGTNDAHGLYARFGFVLNPYPERAMIRPGSYLPAQQ